MLLQCVVLLLCGLGLAGCMSSAPPPPPPKPVARQPAPPDWFQRQVPAAEAARRAHRPADDGAGAQKDYDDVLRAACVKAAVAGLPGHARRCQALLAQPQAPTAPEPQACDQPAETAETLKSCND